VKRLFVIFLLFEPLFGGVPGKIVGKVVDKESGEPLPLVNVSIPGTKIGTATGNDGYFFLLELEPGEYTLEFSYIGYQKLRMEGVKVFPDRTTFLEIKLEPTTLQVSPVVIKAEAPLLEKDITWKVARVKGETFEDLPVFTTEEAISLQGGVTKDAFGGLHVRGGRSGELLYIVDGMPVNDPITGDYEGILDREALRELELYAGAFSAEYGRALSGVVSLVTKEPPSRWNFRGEYFAPALYPFKQEGKWTISTRSLYRRPDAFGENWDVMRDTSGNSQFTLQKISDLYNLPFLGQLRVSLGGPLIPSVRFFLSNLYSNEESHLPFGFDIRRNTFFKLSQSLFGVKSWISLERSERRYQNYSHSWKYRPQHYPIHWTKNWRGSLRVLKLFGSTFSIEAVFGYQKRLSDTKVDDLELEDYEDPVRDPENLEFYILGDYPLMRHEETETRSINLRTSMQWGHHQISLGSEYLKHKLKFVEDSKLYVLGFIGDWLHQDFERTPIEGGLYLQDKIEFKHFIANIGVRYDFQDPQDSMWEDPRNPLSPFVKVPVKNQISPRLGLAFPITETAVLHFSYGHFFEPAPYSTYYAYPQYLENPDLMPELALIGNPDLDPQRTVAYEIGFATLLGDFGAMDVTVYAKDIWDLLTVKEVIKPPYRYTIYETADFATVRGLDISLRVRREKFSIELSYTYQIALGNHSFPTQAFYDVYEGLPEQQKEYPLDFDRRHTINLTSTIRLPRDVTMGLVFEYASGLPYTPYVTTGLVPEPNSARMPSTINVDVRFRKPIKVGMAKATLLLEIRNLLDRKNALAVYNTTGDPWDPGERRILHIVTDDYARNPAHVSAPRRILFGVRFGL
jgi:outer membrane receptor protein involved in Fe transport